METDVGQMLTAGVGLEAMGGRVCMGCGGGAGSWSEGCGPPTGTHTHAHTHTLWAESLGRQFPLSRCCPGRFSQPLGKGRGNHLSVFPQLLPPKQEDGNGVKPLRIFVAVFCSFPSNPPTPRDTCRGQHCLAGAALLFLPQLPPVVCRTPNHSFCPSQPEEPQVVIPSAISSSLFWNP